MAGINCSQCGRWVGPDGFYDAGYDCEGTPECGYPLCKACLDAQPPTLYDLGMHNLQKYKLIYADPPWKLELFARERRQGWDAWGKELPDTMQTLIGDQA